MKTKIILTAFAIWIATMGSMCRKNKTDCHIYYTIKNNSSDAIYFISQRDSALGLINYPPGASPATYKCDANDKKNDALHGSCYETEILFSSTQKLYIFIFDAKIIETVPWDTVKKNHLMLKRYSLTKLQLDSANWVLNYP